MTAFSRRDSWTSRRSTRRLPERLMTACGWLAVIGGLPTLSGCSLLHGPDKAPAPNVPQMPTTRVFDPNDNITKGLPLPGTYRVTGVLSGELLTIQGVVTDSTGKVPTKSYGVPETVRLAGIVAPAPGQPGWQSTVAKVHEWLDGKEDLKVEADAKFPVDLDSHRMVQIYFTHSKGNVKPTNGVSAPGELWNLNRMLVHTGYAVVDLFGATSIDVQQWLNDEEYAKTCPDPKQPTITVTDPVTGVKTQQPNVKPLGLWALGIVIPQRGALSKSTSTATTPDAGAALTTGAPGVIGPQTGTTNRTTTTTTTRTTQSSTRNSIGAPASKRPRVGNRAGEPLPTPEGARTSATTARASANAPARPGTSTSSQ